MHRRLRAGGAGEIVILDGHGSGAVVPELMEPGARYITGRPRPGPLTDLDARFDGVVMLACHAMKGAADGVLNHTQSSKGENRYWYNGVESGELAQYGAIALAFMRLPDRWGPFFLDQWVMWVAVLVTIASAWGYFGAFSKMVIGSRSDAASR